MWKYGFTNIHSFTFCLSTFLFFHLFTFSPFRRSPPHLGTTAGHQGFDLIGRNNVVITDDSVL